MINNFIFTMMTRIHWWTCTELIQLHAKAYTPLTFAWHQDGLAGGGGGEDVAGLGLVFSRISKTSAGVTGSLVSSTAASSSLSKGFRKTENFLQSAWEICSRHDARHSCVNADSLRHPYTHQDTYRNISILYMCKLYIII